MVSKNDPNIFEHWLEYDMPEGFVDTQVDAPAVLLADRLARKTYDNDPATLEAETVTLFLACASTAETNGVPNGSANP